LSTAGERLLLRSEKEALLERLQISGNTNSIIDEYKNKFTELHIHLANSTNHHQILHSIRGIQLKKRDGNSSEEDLENLAKLIVMEREQADISHNQYSESSESADSTPPQSPEKRKASDTLESEETKRSRDDDDGDSNNPGSGSLPPFGPSASSSNTGSSSSVFKVECDKENNFFYQKLFLDFIICILNAFSEDDQYNDQI
jgi:hypothetical protein